MIARQWDREFLWRWRARPLRIIDGDTLVALVDTGFAGRHEAHLRLLDVDAPERDEPGWFEARHRLASVIPRGDDEWPLRVVTLQRVRSADETTSLNRYVADVFVVMDDDDRLINVRDLLRAHTDEPH